MKLPNPYKCDGCGTLKGEANRWWLQLNPVASQDLTVGFKLVTWENAEWDPDSDTVRAHICSEKCAVAALSKWMEEQK